VCSFSKCAVLGIAGHSHQTCIITGRARAGVYYARVRTRGHNLCSPSYWRVVLNRTEGVAHKFARRASFIEPREHTLGVLQLLLKCTPQLKYNQLVPSTSSCAGLLPTSWLLENYQQLMSLFWQQLTRVSSTPPARLGTPLIIGPQT
jgi:hypothetical protein